MNHRKKEKKRKKEKIERNSICPDAILNICGHIRKILNRKHMGKTPSKVAKCSNVKGH